MSIDTNRNFQEITTITISVALLAAAGVLFQNSSVLADVLKLTLSLALAFLGLSVLFNLWFALRWPKRQKLLTAELKTMSEAHSRELKGILDLIIPPIANQEVANLQPNSSSNAKAVLIKLPLQ